MCIRDSLNIDAVSDDKVAELGAFWVTAWSEHSFGLNAFVKAWLGEQEVGHITIDQFGRSFTGVVPKTPGRADSLFVQIDGSEKVDTGLKPAADSV